ncbi:MAG: hypothetical protein LBU65_05835 [Planctomycetaceae bacterium]|nr:hypothetical protein [Planctomycetaceae bacterium]
MFFICIFAAVFGCGENRGLVTVRGTVSCGGQALPGGGSVSFTPAGGQTLDKIRRGTAKFGTDGKFAASTWEQGDGLLPGKYTVRIECWEAAPSFNGSAGVSLIDRKFSGPEAMSGIPVLEVVLGQPQKNLVFEVTLADEKTIEAERKSHQSIEAKAPKQMGQ